MPSVLNSGNDTTLAAESINVLGENGSSYSYGLYNENDATANVTQSVLESMPHSVVHSTGSTGSTAVSNCRLVGSVNDVVNVICVAVSRGGTFNANGCP